jgi:hypothetical protein
VRAAAPARADPRPPPPRCRRRRRHRRLGRHPRVVAASPVFHAQLVCSPCLLIYCIRKVRVANWCFIAVSRAARGEHVQRTHRQACKAAIHRRGRHAGSLERAADKTSAEGRYGWYRPTNSDGSARGATEQTASKRQQLRAVSCQMASAAGACTAVASSKARSCTSARPCSNSTAGSEEAERRAVRSSVGVQRPFTLVTGAPLSAAAPTGASHHARVHNVGAASVLAGDADGRCTSNLNDGQGTGGHVRHGGCAHQGPCASPRIPKELEAHDRTTESMSTWPKWPRWPRWTVWSCRRSTLPWWHRACTGPATQTSATFLSCAASASAPSCACVCAHWCLRICACAVCTSAIARACMRVWARG